MFLNKVAKLIDVKTLITFGVVGTILALALQGKVAPDTITNMGYIIIGFFFGTKKAESNKLEV